MRTSDKNVRSEGDRSRLHIAWITGVGAIIALGFLASEIVGLS